MTHETCEDLLGQLSAYIDGDLDPELCHALETHVADCENCRTVVDTLSDTVHLYRTLPPATVSATLSARLRTALAVLFILHPELADQLDALQLPPAAQTELRTQYTAAACLQRMWSIRLGFYLGEVSLLPDRYSAGLGLPPVNAHYGKLCLHTLAARQPFDQLSAYDSLMSLLFAQLKAETPHEHATAG